MIATVIAKVIDISEKVIKDRDKNENYFDVVTVIDDNAFKDKDRFYPIYLKKGLIQDPKEFLFKNVLFEGKLSLRDGELKFSVIEDPVVYKS